MMSVFILCLFYVLHKMFINYYFIIFDYDIMRKQHHLPIGNMYRCKRFYTR